MQQLRASAGRLERTFPGRCLRTFLDLRGLDRAVVVSSQAFTALIPLLILVAAASTSGSTDVIGAGLVRRFRLEGDAASAVDRLFAQPADSSTGALSALLLVVSVLSLTRRLQAMYQLAWRLPPVRSVRAHVDTGLGLAVLVLGLGAVYLTRSLVGELPADRVLVPLASAGAGLLLWVTLPWLLLDRRVGWRRLLPVGVLMAVGTGVYGVVSTLTMPRMIESYSRRYGLFGITLALIGWLLVIALLLVATTVAAGELDRAQEPWARRLRRRLGVEPLATVPSPGPPERATVPPSATGGTAADPPPGH
ncbi:putative Ribonuclease BN [Modestobacter italicus]|uniref:Ribonuclease BN n=1 Tax=Modestobacter italicus (strain DSM 44449 / CECT 9708 / BC 501) TaxID=2732864 RepID=I4EXX2_MODI5|nr:YhjD/YihY/BrkB family envelope integrity protein [Modestobacter marinus]CCH88235.1 putative Ribonuclease BN [Modestobacter marinus]